MKKIILLSLISMIFFVSSIQASTPATVTASYLNVRQQPTTNSSVIDILPNGTSVEVEYLSKDLNWSKIKIENISGYVFNLYLDIENSASLNIEEQPSLQDEPSNNEIQRFYEPSDFEYLGVLNYNGWRWTWYSEKILPGPGLNIPGRHTNSDGYVCDENEYICLASVDLPQGTIVKTPLGYYGKVYDTGCPSGTLDVYTNF